MRENNWATFGRSLLAELHGVECARCGHVALDESATPRQKYLLDEPCEICGHVRRSRKKQPVSNEKGDLCLSPST